ncbi:phosphohydrolase [Mycolicibacterium conceptionense]|uniref:Phosphohydrolase n=1 Tax=Mycolicibacterium conceptionense TaxID=451644 RepID=A0A0J8UGS0_9MYCO|nr:phosphohydrolase [Mycolicibacterium conceptionense]KMV19590.1 phosphohydrolase [Mycolicibacterium conceptionense]
MSLDLDTVIELALHAHIGQRDKLGRDYGDGHLAPIAAAASSFGPLAVQAAWLHDTIEDTALTAPLLLVAGVDPVVVAAVESVTRIPGEKYTELIERAAAHPIGRYVKLVDNAWNITLNPALAEVDPGKGESMLTGRYLPARRRLLDACGLTEDAPEVLAMQRVLDEHRDRLR